MDESATQRFLKYVSPEPNTGCWLWTGHIDKWGYGRFFVSGNGSSLAHRASWAIHRGNTEGLHVLHRCDNPPCVNPVHLWLGTNFDNMRDMMTKGRKRVSARDGGRNPNAKLTAGQVKDIRELHASGWRYPALAERFDVSVGCIRSIALFENWRSA